MRKLLALLLAMTMVIALVACGGDPKPADPSNPPADTQQPAAPSNPPADTQQPAEPSKPAPVPDGVSQIRLCTYQRIGDSGFEASLKALTNAFTAETGIAVKTTVDSSLDELRTRLIIHMTQDNSDAFPDLVFAPNVLLGGRAGIVGAPLDLQDYMIDLTDMFDSTDIAEINAVNESIMELCTHPNGAIYEYPLAMTVACMAVNLNAFKEAGADQYLDLDTHTWTTDNFIKAVDAVYSHYNAPISIMENYIELSTALVSTSYPLVTNLYGGTFTDAEYSRYTWDDPRSIKALELLSSMDGIASPNDTSGVPLTGVYDGSLKMLFGWSITKHYTLSEHFNLYDNPLKTFTGDDIAFMRYPSEDGNSTLDGAIWGFGIFDNDDQAQIDAAKLFIKFMCDSAHTVDAVKATGLSAVRSAAEGTDLSSIWADDEIRRELDKLMPFLGNYYYATSTPGWMEAGGLWGRLIYDITADSDPAQSVAYYLEQANASAAAAS